MHTSPFSDTDELKMAIRARKVSGAFERRAPGTINRTLPDAGYNQTDQFQCYFTKRFLNGEHKLRDHL